MDVVGNSGEHTHEHETPVIAPVIETGNDLAQPVIDHTEKITRIEERQAQHQEEMLRQLSDLEGRLVTATGSQVGALEDRIVKLEARIAESAESAEPDAVELTLPDVETSPAPPEKMRQGLRQRRKTKRKK